MVGAALDEACGLLATWYRFPTVTARIFVRFRKPVPIKRRLSVAARLTGVRGRRLHVDGRLRDGDEVLAEARAAFLHVPLEHFLAAGGARRRSGLAPAPRRLTAPGRMRACCSARSCTRTWAAPPT
jgi:Thioesterase superfamily